MSTDFDSFSNRGEYFSAHYFAEQLGGDLKKNLFATWAAREGDDHDDRRTPRELLRGLRSAYMTDELRSYFAECAQLDNADDTLPRTYGDPEWETRLRTWHQDILRALGFTDSGAAPLQVHRAGKDHLINVAYQGHGIVALDCGWAAENDTALDTDGPGRLLTPLQVGASEAYETGAALASWLFHSELGKPGGDPPRFVLLLAGGVLVLADRNSWGEGRYLAANLDAALERNDRKQGGELATIAALFSVDMLRPGDNDSSPLIDSLLKASSDNAVGVSSELRHGLQRSVEILANEVLARLEETGLTPSDIEDPQISFSRQLTRESLRYLYRILFLLYAEARPELGILPADDGSYEAGYSMARLRELVARDEQLAEEAAKNGFHLFESLDVLFANVNYGHRPYGTEPDDDQSGDDEETRAQKARRRSEDRGLRFEPLRSELFEPRAIRLIGRWATDPRADEDEPAWLDLRLRNAALHEVLRLLTMKKASRRGERGGFISYRNLGINQLGAVYEGLMSYTGFIADEDLCEVAKNGKTNGGSWLIPASKQDQYPDDVFVHYDEEDAKKGLRGRKKYPRGSFVYRLAGRDRETSASYYTPESLTKVTVELALKHRLDQERDREGNPIKTRAAELLQYKICEPALGSGAFLNEAINQVAEQYLRRRQDELGVSIPTVQAVPEKQKVKAYIALHNCYGVDLNATGVELAEVSLWLNTMHPGMNAPWFGLHLRRGNSLIGARRAVFSGEDVMAKEKAWLKSKGPLAPTEVPFLQDGERQELPEGAIHQFLLPAPGWGAVAGEKEAKTLGPEAAAQLARWKRGICKAPRTKAPRGKLSQLERLQALARRAEFLWDLVIQRMKISEHEISRNIDVWGTKTDPNDPEYAFLRRPNTAVAKEKVYRDLFEMTGTPYWRLKTVMDTWCALWFWPVTEAGLLDGTDEEYAGTDDQLAADALADLPEVEEVTQGTSSEVAQESIAHYSKQPPLFSTAGEQESLFTGSNEDESLSSSVPAVKPSATKHRAPAAGQRAKIPLKDLTDWLDFAEAVLGTHGEPGDLLSVEPLDSLAKMEKYESELPRRMGMDPDWKLAIRFPWLRVVANIAQEQGFLHWELDFGLVFAQSGGFDLQVGNPPWVRPRWDEAGVLAEYDPWFKLTEKASTTQRNQRREVLIADTRMRRHVLRELAATSATVAFLSSPQTYSLLGGTQPDLYRGFMCRVWDHATADGVAGLVHPDSHFSGDKEVLLRHAAYKRLRVHGDFVNAGNRFFPPPVGRSSHFGLHVYGCEKEIGFEHLSWLFSVDALRLSDRVDDTDTDPDPGVRYGRTWDERPHHKRIIRVDNERLARWQQLTGEHDQPVERARLLSPVSTAEDQAIAALADYPVRTSAFSPQIARGFDESGAKKAGVIEYNVFSGVGNESQGWFDLILKGPQLGVANPMFKQPSQGDGEVLGLNLTEIAPDDVPETEYVRATGEEEYAEAQDRWVDHQILEQLRSSEEEVTRARAEIAAARIVEEDEIDDEDVDQYLIEKSRRPYTAFHRVAWREFIAPDTERSLYAGLLPPGPAHIHAVRSASMPDHRHTALVAGFWAALPVDYLLRTTRVRHLDAASARRLPAPSADHPLASALLLRTLRLNCLTIAYEDLWAELYDAGWSGSESWVYDWPGLQPLDAVAPTWSYDTPLRTERARHAALVELDALVAVWLGVDADALVAMYKARFPILQDFDAVTWFDAHGRKIAGNRYTYGHGQTKEHYEQLQAYLKDPDAVLPPDGYIPPFYKAHREDEMKEAHKVFQARLDDAVARGEWDPIRQEVPER